MIGGDKQKILKNEGHIEIFEPSQHNMMKLMTPSKRRNINFSAWIQEGQDLCRQLDEMEDGIKNDRNDNIKNTLRNDHASSKENTDNNQQ